MDSEPTSSNRSINAKVSRPVTLSEYYYLEHLEEVIAKILKAYRLKDKGAEFTTANQFMALNRDQRCIVVRAFNRKKELFTADDFLYPEIHQPIQAFSCLCHLGFFSAPEPRDFQKILPSLSKKQLTDLLKAMRVDFKASWTKKKMIDCVTERRFDIPWPWMANLGLVFRVRLDLSFLLYLFFGDIRKNMAAFTYRDLKITQSSRTKISNKPRFNSVAAARVDFFYAHLNESIKTWNSIPLDDIQFADWPEPQTEAQRRHFNKLLLKIAKPQSLPEKGSVLARATGHPARIEFVRFMLKQQDRSHAKGLLEKILSQPSCGEELVLAENIYGKQFAGEKLNITTQMLRDAETCSIDEAFRGRPEWGLRERLKAEGWVVDRAENNLWRGLFGLLFWDLLYGEKSESIHSEFDTIPMSLKDKTFYRRHQDIVKQRLAQIQSPQTQLFILKNYTEYYGQKNSIFRWRKTLFLKIKRLIEGSEPSGLHFILEALARDFKANRSGFPDLVLYKNRQIEWVEVKSEGDVLRPNQMYQIKQLQKAGYLARIINTNYAYNPQQVYSVVDIETTGGLNKGHRITEIGVAKLKGGQIIDTWSQLINPGRPIPPFITKLTGINNSMVAQAPSFADVSGDFLNFIKDSIFVAHNVRFDYGFIQKEFERIGQSFRSPSACTCQLARKFLPGYKSYGLKNLSQQLGIELKNHHRALDDAVAAARILIHINKKRQNGNSTDQHYAF